MTLSVQPSDIDDNYTLIDATWVMPGRTDPLDNYLTATATSIDTNSIKAAPIAQRLTASADAFGQAGLTGEARMAVYDRAGLFSAPWIWWLLRSHGSDVTLVEGWGATQADVPTRDPVTFKPSANPSDMNATRDDVLAALGTTVQILDARPPGRFAGTAAEPRPECRAGHIPGSVNVPFGSLKSGRTFHAADDLRALFQQSGVDLSRPVITSCGSGVTASGLAFALTRCGAENVQVYQGSWAEWGTDPTCPIETGS
ncbi:sulfurtransferase [Algimonas porphyrae]|uniref:Sulfurtransferase n=1 Tax=Algimonas porphyrae TaxID=1128113 RepID=A0ABQ5UVC7_9PROT|nr:rhodanese-like domain-containing protein [Algimonas porphyrae]GLQ19111.1 sulfurtransferase [Algimonas porphyrae]